jgi:hypothetical protein
MSNGKMSPIFLTREQTDNHMEDCEVDFSKVKKIRGTSNSYWISQIHLNDKNNEEVKRFASY